MKKSLSIAAILASALSTQAIAKETPVYDIVYTPNRVAEKESESIGNTSVISKDEIQTKQYKTVEQALQSVPGISIANSGGLGKQSSLFLRGTNSNHAVILIDGVKVNGATTGTFNLNTLDISQIERIEVSQGPNAALYGSNAIGGVIQIFTSKGKQDNHHITVSAGSNDAKKITAGVSKNFGKIWVNANASKAETDGFDAYKGADLDDDGNENKSYAINAGLDLNKYISVDTAFLASKNLTEYDAPYGGADLARSRQNTISSNIRITPTENWDIKISHSEVRDNAKQFQDSTSNSTGFINNKSKQSSIQSTIRGDKQQLTLGADTEGQTVDASTDYAVKSRRIQGLFIQYKANLGDTSFQSSFRRDKNDQFGKSNTKAFQIQHKLTDNLRAEASYGTAFKAPTFNELYWPGYANPTLKPQTSKNKEIGLKYSNNSSDIKLSVYENKIQQLITSKNNTVINTPQAKIKGLELSAKHQFNNLQVSGDIGLINHQDNNGERLLKRPTVTNNLGMNYNLGKVNLGLNYFRQNDSIAYGGTVIEGFQKVDLTGDLKITPQITVGAKLSNASDKEYETSSSYNQAGREAEIFFRYSGK